jgi:hypothetical protein
VAFAWLGLPLWPASGGGAARAAEDPPLTDLDRAVMASLSAKRETPRAIFHFEPGAVDAAQIDAAVKANVAELETLEKTLAMKYRGQVHFFLYRDVPEMVARTGVGAGVVAFSTGTVSVHQAHDFRGCHELVHIFALQFPPLADGSGADGFVVEGLATALAKSDEGFLIADWGACHARLSTLPDSLQEFRRRWPEGAKAGVHPYHVAGAFVGWLVEKHGIAKVKQWYVDSSEAHRWLGKGFGQLEREWREAMDERKPPKEALAHVKRKLGIEFEALPDAYAKAKGAALIAAGAKGDGPPSGLAAENAACWSVADGVLRGANDQPWSHLATVASHPASVGVRATLRLVKGDAIKLRVNGDRELVLGNWSSFLKVGEGFAGNDRLKLKVGQWHEVVLVNEGGRARAWLDGEGLFDLPGAWHDAGAGSLGIAVEKGELVVKRWEAFAARG